MDPSQSNDAPARPSIPHQASPGEAFRRNEEQFRLLVDAVTEYAIFMIDPTGHVASWNAGAERIKGYTEAEILGRHFSVFYTEEDTKAGRPAEVLEKATQDGKWVGEGWRVRKDGSRFWAHATVAALYSEEGQLRGFAKVTRDLTARKKREEELEREKQRAEQAKQQAERENALLQLMQAVSATANDADTLDEAMREAMRAVCVHTGWPVGHVYRVRQVEGVRDGAPRLVPTGIWHIESAEQSERLCAVTEETTFDVGEGLPGQVAERGAAVWIRDVSEDPSFVRRPIAEDPGVKGAFGIPVRHKDETVAVLEFFSEASEEPDEEFIEAMESVGVQLSRVAERERAREKLRRSEVRYRRLFDTVQEGIVIQAADRTITDINAAGLEILGYDRGELVGKEPTALFADIDQRRRAQQIIKEQGQFRNLEFELRRKDGQTVICEATGTVLQDAEGRPEALYTVLRDVTARKRAEAALRESEAKFRALAEEAPVGIAIVQDGRFKYVNEQFAVIYGYAPEELVDTIPAERLVHPEDRPLQREMMRRRIEGEVEAVRFQMRIITKQGSIRHVELHGARIVYQDRPAVIGSVLDITERQKSEAALRESEERFRKLIEEALVGIYLVQDGVYEYVNPAYARMYGYAPEEMIGQSPMAFLHPSEHERAKRKVHLRMSGESDTGRGIYRVRRKSGETFFADVSGVRITYRGRPAILGMAQDVTERRRLQREVLSVQEEERRRLGQDLHDGVASQLTGVGIMLGVLARRLKQADLDIGEVAGEVEEIRALVNESGEDVRRLSRGLAPAGLSEEGLVPALRRLARNTDGGQFKADADLPALESDVAAHLYWIAREAITNARKYAEADVITIRVLHQEGALLLEIEDDGRGFDASRALDEGLGLRSMRYRAEVLGAEFAIHSASGQGTRVCCRVLA